MRSAVTAALVQIQAQHEVRVLYAAESGSRAWGFASPDSDFDVRFIYVHRPDWYLRLDEPRDVIEAMLPGDLDLAGWDLRKTLRLYLRSNIALYEWLDSPIVYLEAGSLAQQLRDWLPRAFRAPAGYHHYLSTAQGIAHQHLQQPPIRLKKLFYALRPLLACRWIRATGAQPPTAFSQLCQADWVSDDERAMIAGLLAAKRETGESASSQVANDVLAWLRSELMLAEAGAGALAAEASLKIQDLNPAFLRWLQEAWPSDAPGQVTYRV
ncbi:MAG: nucleotidyltransferase domain-containing protein [Xanthomonadales bacterium]|nr:nucleotidyltransferase domain-containing protein [Xanthomonadales bacterium]